MFEATLKQAALLKKIVDATKDLVSEANFECSATGITLQAMDTSHVSLIAFNLSSETFEKYRCDFSVSIGINFASLAKVLKCAGNDDTCLLGYDDGDTLSIVFTSPNQDRVSKFDLKLLSIDADMLAVPEIPYKVDVTMSSSEFARISRDLTNFADTVTIGVNKNSATFSADGDTGKAAISVKPSDASVDEGPKGKGEKKGEDSVPTIITLEEPVSLTFAVRYLNHFTKATALSPSVQLSMSPDVPLAVEYKIGESGFIRYYLAPRIDENDNGAEDSKIEA